MPNNVSGSVRFEEYEIDRAKWRVRFRDEVLSLNRKTFDLLLYLVEHSDRVVSKSELLRALWPDSFVEESNLTQHVFLLRKALSRHPSGTKIIETVPGRGYRFAVPVEVELRPEPGSQSGVVALNGLSGATSPAVAERNGVAEQPGSPLQEQEAEAPSALPDAPESRDRQSRSATPLTSRWTLALTAAGVLLAVFWAIRWAAPAAEKVSTYNQVTHDGHAKSIGGTDGSRIYFTQLDKSDIAQVSISGGTAAPIPLAIRDPWSGMVSPDGSALLIVSQASGQGPAVSLWTLNLISGSLRKLGYGISAAWSPDGERIVYACANGDLFIMRSDGSESRRIASPGGYIPSIAWSPDGETIRFTKDGLLWQISGEGRDLHQLLPGWSKTPTQWSGEWSREGRYYYVSEGQIWELQDRPGIAGKRRHSPVQLTFGPIVWDRPLPSLDGKRLFASGRVRHGELVRLDSQTSQFESFLAGISAEFVTFSSTGNAIAYVSYPEGILWRADTDGSNPVQLTRTPVHPKTICWSPDGTQIAFVDRSEEGVDAIFLIAADGSGKPHRLVPGDAHAETDPSWSPDGQEVTYSTSPNVGGSAKSDLRTFHRATGTITVVPDSDGLLVPRWSPDGHLLAAMNLDAETLKLFDGAKGNWRVLDTGPVAFPEWSHDGRFIYYVRWTADPAVLRIRIADGRREVVTRLTGARYTGTYTLWMGLDPTDQPMMLRDEGTDEIYALTLERK